MTAAADTGFLAALAGLELATVARLRVLLSRHDPAEAWAVAGGRHPAHPAAAPMLTPELRAAWHHGCAERGPDTWARRCAQLGIRAVSERDPDYPLLLRTDPQPPAVLFARGSWDVLDRRRVGIVGTRNATGPGCDFAFTLGRELAAADVVVVSGL